MINFSDLQWERIRETYRKFWDGSLNRPILPCIIKRKRTIPPRVHYADIFNFSYPVAEIVEAIDEDLSCCEFLGDSFPMVGMGMFGPGCLAVILDSEVISVRPGLNTVWALPKHILPIEELHFEFQPSNPWYNRLKDLYITGTKKWRGEVIMAMTDLGSALDILSTFRTPENLLTDLYDTPGQVKRCINEIHTAWLKCYFEIEGIISENAAGFTDWAGIYSEKPSYMLQCDFSYMIGPDMFKEFVLTELKATAKQLNRPFYHLDGTGALPHLDTLLQTDEIAGIQWVPGAGREDWNWLGVYEKIAKSGRKMQIIDIGDEIFHHIVETISSPSQIMRSVIEYSKEDREKALAILSRYNVTL